MALIDDNLPKHTITNSEVFQKAREQLGHLILKNMEITGGTDVDWLIERKGGFIILESKLFREEHITIPVGQMIAFERLYEQLSSSGKCYFYLFANEDNIDFTNPESPVWYFEMSEWKKKKIPQNKTKTGKYYRIKKDVMAKIPIKHFRILIEHHWKEFDKKKIDLKPKLQRSPSKISKKEKAYSIKEIQKTYPKAYVRWTESDDELLKKFWKENKQSKNDKILLLMLKFGRKRGAILSRLNKMGLDLEEKYPAS